MKNVSYSLKKFFGFTKSGASLLGSKFRKIFVPIKSSQRMYRFIGFGIAFVIFSSILFRSMTNIGGTLAVSIDSANLPSIDATTTSSVQLPIEFTYESRGFSWFHTGADLVAQTGTTVKPVMTGVVKETNDDRFGYGRHVIIDHGNGYTSLYGHLSQILVVPGQKVTMETIIGKSGSTGFSTGPHLHLEVRYNNSPVNPAEIVPGVK